MPFETIRFWYVSGSLGLKRWQLFLQHIPQMWRSDKHAILGTVHYYIQKGRWFGQRLATLEESKRCLVFFSITLWRRSCSPGQRYIKSYVSAYSELTSSILQSARGIFLFACILKSFSSCVSATMVLVSDMLCNWNTRFSPCFEIEFSNARDPSGRSRLKHLWIIYSGLPAWSVSAAFVIFPRVRISKITLNSSERVGTVPHPLDNLNWNPKHVCRFSNSEMWVDS